MSAPAEVNTSCLAARFILNRELSSLREFERMLELKGVGWLTRRALCAATPTLTIRHYADAASGAEHIEVDEVSGGGRQRSEERRVLDWAPRCRNNLTHGPIINRARRAPVAPEDVDAWTADTREMGVVEVLLEDEAATWSALQIWGFKERDGVRRYVREFRFTGPNGEKISGYLWYDYLGPIHNA